MQDAIRALGGQKKKAKDNEEAKPEDDSLVVPRSDPPIVHNAEIQKQLQVSEKL